MMSCWSKPRIFIFCVFIERKEKFGGKQLGNNIFSHSGIKLLVGKQLGAFFVEENIIFVTKNKKKVLDMVSKNQK